MTYTFQSVMYESHVSNYRNHKNIYGLDERQSKASITLFTQSGLAFYLCHKQIGVHYEYAKKYYTCIHFSRGSWEFLGDYQPVFSNYYTR